MASFFSGIQISNSRGGIIFLLRDSTPIPSDCTNSATAASPLLVPLEQVGHPRIPRNEIEDIHTLPQVCFHSKSASPMRCRFMFDVSVKHSTSKRLSISLTFLGRSSSVCKAFVAAILSDTPVICLTTRVSCLLSIVLKNFSPVHLFGVAWP